MYKVGQCIIDRRTKEAYEIVKVWGYLWPVDSVSCSSIEQSPGIYVFTIDQLTKHFKVLTSSREMVRLLYSIRAKAVTNGKPTEP